MRGISVFAFLITMLVAAASENAAAEKISLRMLDRNPDRYLGKTVSIDGLLGKDIAISGNRATFAIVGTAREKPTFLKFVAPLSLAEQIGEELKADARPVRIIGTVMAPAAILNAPYLVEVEEITFLDAKGTAEATCKPKVVPVEKPVAAPAIPATAPVIVAEPAKAAELFEELPMNLIIPGAAAVAVALVGGGVGLFFLLRRKPAAPAAPVRSVSERLERRKR